MTATGIHNLDHAVHQTNVWLKELDEKLHWEDRAQSLMALRVTLHALRDHLMIEEGAHFTAQLPLIIRGLYYEGWVPAKVPVKERHLDQFLARIRDNFQQAPGPGAIDPTRIARCVFEVINDHVSLGEIDDVRGMLPRKIAQLWPEPRPQADGRGAQA